MANWVEIDLDYIDQIIARAENTIILIGLPRVRMISPISRALFLFNYSYSETLSKILDIVKSFSSDFITVGMVQGLSFNVIRQRATVFELGKERPTFLTSPSSIVSLGISRLIAYSDSLFKKFTSTIPDDDGFINWSQFEDPSKFDASLYRTEDVIFPFGIGLIIYSERDIRPIAKLYFEGCKLESLGSVITTGNPITVENVQIIGHRVVQLDTKDIKES
ncbi:MAG: hypothetical protein DSY42_09405 [Aquifex sp.]|nr:MAG: hypothetical protein DSY42_09405 [Aquifex sp.]